MLNFYDFEVFKYDWLVVVINPIEKTRNVIVNNADELSALFNRRKDEIWIGYNNKGYDQYIMKAILCGFDPKEVNDYIIKYHCAGWQFSNLFRKIQMYNYDIMQANDGGLKSLEGFMGNNIKETSIPFDIDRKLTAAEIEETIKYCCHDVEQTMETWLQRKGSFDAIMGLIKAFELPLSDISKTDTQLSAKILGATRRNYDDEFNIKIPDTLILKKYKCVLDWFCNTENHCYKKEIIGKSGKKRFVNNKLKIDIAGVPHVFGWGGIHGAIPKYSGRGYFLMIDVTSLYPSLMIRYGLTSRSCIDPKKFEMIYKTNIEMKKTKDPLRPAYKLVCNKTYGGMKDVNNALYDPLQANNVCVYGQLLLLDLIEKLEPHCQLIQSNTDGLLIKMLEPDTESNRDRFFNKIDEIVKEWEKRTGLEMEFDEYTKIYQKDVNNYIAIDVEGKAKCKGAYVKKLSRLDYDLPIVNEALNAYMIHNVPVETTINNCQELIKFQKIVKLSSKYNAVHHNGKKLNEKCFRVFASLDKSDSFIGKSKSDKIEKFANTPENCFIFNDNVNGVSIPKTLNKQWYIDLALKRLGDFGV
jgi:DNA polymerase